MKIFSPNNYIYKKSKKKERINSKRRNPFQMRKNKVK